MAALSSGLPPAHSGRLGRASDGRLDLCRLSHRDDPLLRAYERDLVVVQSNFVDSEGMWTIASIRAARVLECQQFYLYKVFWRLLFEPLLHRYLHVGERILKRLYRDLPVSFTEPYRLPAINFGGRASLYLWSTAVVIAIGSRWTLFTVLALVVFCEIGRRFYGATSRQLRALEAASKTRKQTFFSANHHSSSWQALYSTAQELNDTGALEVYRCFRKEDQLLEEATFAINVCSLSDQKHRLMPFKAI
jgi:hypothetical protein